MKLLVKAAYKSKLHDRHVNVIFDINFYFY